MNGARPIDRAIQQHFTNPLAQHILEHSIMR